MGYLGDHPMTCKWLITIVSFRPLSRVSLVIYKWGVTPLANHLISGVILQVTPIPLILGRIHPCHHEVSDGHFGRSRYSDFRNIQIERQFFSSKQFEAKTITKTKKKLHKTKKTPNCAHNFVHQPTPTYTTSTWTILWLW